MVKEKCNTTIHWSYMTYDTFFFTEYSSFDLLITCVCYFVTVVQHSTIVSHLHVWDSLLGQNVLVRTDICYHNCISMENMSMVSSDETYHLIQTKLTPFSNIWYPLLELFFQHNCINVFFCSIA